MTKILLNQGYLLWVNFTFYSMIGAEGAKTGGEGDIRSAGNTNGREDS